MQLTNLGNSLDAAKSIQEVINKTEIFSKCMAGNALQQRLLKEATSGYSTEVLKLSSSQVTLSTAQAKAIFEAKELTGAELDAAVATATASTTKKSSTVAINLNTMSKIGNKEATEAEISEEIKSLLLKGKLITEEQIQAKTTVELTKAKIADAVATGNLTKAEGKQLTSTLGLTGATGGLGTAFKGLGAKIKATTASMWTFLTTILIYRKRAIDLIVNYSFCVY